MYILFPQSQDLWVADSSLFWSQLICHYYRGLSWPLLSYSNLSSLSFTFILWLSLILFITLIIIHSLFRLDMRALFSGNRGAQEKYLSEWMGSVMELSWANGLYKWLFGKLVIQMAFWVKVPLLSKKCFLKKHNFS